ncbi:MAG: 4-hydroxythreonine-4-phosphate dehydrogenase PdxA, partial [Candidatus Margulisiibacteriota bacterium]
MIKPRIGISIGDPAGIGPEIIAKALAATEITSICDPVVISSSEYGTKQHEIKRGQVQALGGKIAVESLLLAIEQAQTGLIDAIVTAPLSKEAMHLAGYKYNGHTEILAEITRTKEYAMLFYSETLNVILTTIHCALADVPKLLTREQLEKTIRLGKKFLLDLGLTSPRILVLGLNPHAGENGLFGREEQEIISPVVESFKQQGLNITGPWAPDTAIRTALRDRYDLVVAQYHDQGLIPLKMLAFDTAVNVTVGLPIIRTSPDHGTA